MSELWKIVQAHRDRYGPSVSEVARRMGVGSQTLFNWRDRPMRELPTRRVLVALSEVTGEPYQNVLRAALLDAGYESEESLPTPVEADSHETDTARLTPPKGKKQGLVIGVSPDVTSLALPSSAARASGRETT